METKHLFNFEVILEKGTMYTITKKRLISYKSYILTVYSAMRNIKRICISTRNQRSKSGVECGMCIHDKYICTSSVVGAYVL